MRALVLAALLLALLGAGCGADPERAASPAPDEDSPQQFRYVEEFVRHELSKTLGGPRGMIESALPFVAFTACWMITRDQTGLPLSPLYVSLGAALASAIVLAVIWVPVAIIILAAGMADRRG